MWADSVVPRLHCHDRRIGDYEVGASGRVADLHGPGAHDSLGFGEVVGVAVAQPLVAVLGYDSIVDIFVEPIQGSRTGGDQAFAERGEGPNAGELGLVEHLMPVVLAPVAGSPGATQL